MKYNIVVCDDENLALKINCVCIEELIKKYKIDASVTGFVNGDKLIEFAENNEVDLAFLDIDLKGMNGIVVAARILKKNPKVTTIFITGHREFAYDAFTVEAFSYLTKPIDPDRLERIFKKAILHANDVNNRKLRVAPLVITEENIKKKINQSIIIYIERVETQSTIVTKTSKHYVYETITSLAERLEENFLRINQGIIVNLIEVSILQGNQVTMKTGEVFTIGRTYSKAVKKRYLEYPQE
ncbi:MAG: DNA-binding response regulator [Herbinix sp.]|jgi:DNA-binding LytR/AlgR family response regulator|nr:DNA-binding response regulator [Herbinix sp.]